MKNWISEQLESLFFIGFGIFGAFFCYEVSVLIPWMMGHFLPVSAVNILTPFESLRFNSVQMLVNMALYGGIVVSPMAAILCAVRPKTLPAWLGHMYTNKFRLVYAMVQLGMFILIATQIGRVYDISGLIPIFGISAIFSVAVMVLCAVYHWASGSGKTPNKPQLI